MAYSVIKSKGARDSLVMVVGNTLAVSMSAVGMMIISRFLGPEKFGVFSVGFAITLMLSKINDLGLAMTQMKYVPKAINEERKNRIFSWVVKSKLLMYLVIVIFGVLLVPWIAQVLNFSDSNILYGAFIFSVGALVFEQLAAMLQSLQKVRESVYATAVQGFVKMVGSLGLWWGGATSVMVAFAVYTLAPLSTLLGVKKWLPSWTHISIKGNYSSERKLMWVMAGSSMINYVSISMIDNLDVLFVQRYLTPIETGLYGGVSRIALLFAMAAYSLGAVLNPRVSKYTAKYDLDSYIKKAVQLSAVVILSILALVPLSQLIIYLTIGVAYLSAAATLNVLMLAGVLTIASTLLAAIFFSFQGAEWYFSIAGLLQLFIVIGGNWLFVPVYGMEGAAWVRVGAKIALIVLTIILAAWQYRKIYLKKNS